MDINTFYNDIDDILYNKSYDEELRLFNWKSLKKKINLSQSHPVQINRVLAILHKKFLDRKDIKILDHGCGGSYTILYLYALNYHNVFGVDIGGDYKEINNFFFLTSRKYEQKKIIYDGIKLPFEDEFFDFIFTQQVMEHIPFSNLRNFIKEESRVLKLEGIAYHQIPHKLVPYEAHIKIWLVHWLPKNLFILICKFLGKNYKFIKVHLWLEFPWKYLTYLSKYIGSTKNLSTERIKLFNNESKEFNGLSYIIRKFCSSFHRVPIIGSFLSKIMSYFIMLETVSVKKNVKF
jgi:SAM-dependent methyltransferase